MKELRQRVSDQNALPSGGFKKIEQLDQWVQNQSSNPDMADLATSIGMMSESLSRALGSTQGGEFMLKYANTLLDKNFAPEAFDRLVDRHEATLFTKLQARRHFGEDYVIPKETMPGEKPANGSLSGGGQKPTKLTFDPATGTFK
jgi:hypothetical protein